MKFRPAFPVTVSLLVTVALLATSTYGAETLSVDYDYTGNHNTDFSGFSADLKIEEFGDNRGGDPSLIAGDYSADAPLAAIIRDALIQGFEHGKARLSDADDALRIAGNIVSSDIRTVNRGGVESLQLTIRFNVQLRGRGRTIWETVLFGRGVVPVDDGIEAAVNGSLDRMIRELVGDDYFLLELQ
jgi:hypothetical protein